jgi:uncharacterized protein YbcV (DUF1398 family)
MFTLQQLKAAHAKVQTGADFPRYIQEIKALGLMTYDYMVQNGVTVYHGAVGHTITADAMYPELTINAHPSAEALRHAIRIHQQGQTDFLTFCEQAADAGVERWVIDTQNMLCSYLDAQGHLLVAEPISEPVSE